MLEERIRVLEQTVRALQEQSGQSENSEAVREVDALQADAVPPVSSDPARTKPVEVSGYLFGDYYWMAAHHDQELEDQNGFWVRRAYLTFDRSLRRDLDVRFRLEVNSAGDFESGSKLQPLTKDAYVRWKLAARHEAYMGLSSTPTWNLVEEIWGYRAVERTLADLQKLGSSRDLGVALRGSLDSESRVRYHFMVGNGSGTGSETNEGKKVSFSLGFRPLDSLVLEFYGDYESLPLDADQQTLQGFVGYERPWGRLGLQFVHQSRDGLQDLELDGLSLFGVYRLSPRVSFFGRYDRMFDPNPEGAGIAYLPFDPGARSNLFLTGLDFRVSEDFSLMPNVELIRYDEQREDGSRPGMDVIPRLTFFYTF